MNGEHGALCGLREQRAYAGSLELRKLYQYIPDPEAERHQQLRVVYESGEDYLYSSDRFVLIKMTKEQSSAVLKAL